MKGRPKRGHKIQRELVQKERCEEMGEKQQKEGRKGFSWAKAMVMSVSHYISRSLSYLPTQIVRTTPWIHQHANHPLYLRKLNSAANLDWGHRGLLTERSQLSGKMPFLPLNQSLHKPKETAAAGATDSVKGGRLRTVIMISSYITCLFFKVLYKHQLINSLLCPMQIHWFFK